MGLRRIGRRIGRAFRRVAKVGKSIVGGITKGIGGLAKGVMGIAGKVLDKLPFGNVIKGFAQQILKNPMALLTLGGLGGIGALIGMAGGPAQLAQIAQTVAGTAAFQNPTARANMMHMLAAQHAARAFQYHMSHVA